MKVRLLTLELNLILNNQGLILVVNLLGELGRDGMVSGGVLDHQTLVALNALQHGGLLDRPFTDVGPILLRLGILLLRVGGSPSGVPVVRELLQEWSLKASGLVYCQQSRNLRDCGNRAGNVR